MSTTTGGAPLGLNRGFVLTGEPTSTRRLLGDLWQARELVFMLSRKEFFVKYRRTTFGLLWSMLLPIVQASLMAVVLSRFVRFETGTSYAVFIYSGTLAFNFMSNGLSFGVGSLVDNNNLSTKIYFPRLVLPLVVVGAGFYALVPGLGVLIVMAALLDAPIGVDLLFLIPAVALLGLFTASLAAVLSMTQVYVRDARYVVGAAMQPWFYVTPVVYPLVAVGRFRDFIEVNPATGVVELFRAAVGSEDPGWLTAVGWTGAWTVVLAVVAGALFRRHDRNAVDLL